MAENHIIKVKYSPKGYCRTRSVFRYDYGQVLELDDFNELPQVFEVHFAKPGANETITVLGEDTFVKVPDECLTATQAVAWLFLHDSESDGETRFVINIPVEARKPITNSEPSEQEHDIVSEAIVVLNRTIEETNAAKDTTLAAEEHVVSLASVIDEIKTDTLAAKDDAFAAADEAVRMAAEAEIHANDAASSASEAETALGNIQELTQQAQESTENAQEYARQAQASAETAAGSESNAAFSQRQAHEDMLATESIRNDVAGLKNDVTDLKDDVTQMRSQVFQSANDAAESAVSAADSAAAASVSAQEVHEAVEDIVATATASAESAARSASASQEAARNASSYAVRAESAGNTAESAATRASTNANNASRYATSARNYAASAERYATDAESAKEEIERLAIEQSRAIAPVQERQAANQAYNVGDYFVYDNHLYQVTSAIRKDETILPGTNCAQTTVTDEIKDIQTMDIHICTVGEYDSETELPTIQNPDSKTFYLVPGGDAPNLYVEWVYTNNVWEQFGSATIDLSNYLQKSDIDDTAGSGDTDKVWSANKISSEIDTKYAKPSSGIPASDLADGVIPNVPVQDVRVNGTSILSDGVANVPVATTQRYGVVLIGNGLQTKGNTLYVNPATVNDAKNGAHEYRPIAPSNQHNSVFYGLAKAAGSDEKDSTLPVGTYTDAAKSAIRTMIGAASVEDIPEAPVQDVQVNGVSVLDQNGAANVPVASAGTFGAVKVNSQNGVAIYSDGALYINNASENDLKTGQNDKKPLTSNRINIATFYGLARAAGDTTQSQSSNAVGAYTPEAKAAIQTMLGIETGIEVVRLI